MAGETTRTTATIYFVIIGAMMITFFVGASGLPALLTQTLTSSGLPNLAIIVLLVVLYLVLGSIMDAFTIMIITAPLVAAVIVQLGYDPDLVGHHDGGRWWRWAWSRRPSASTCS